ncbi:MAG TPA: acetyl-CoA carboxylase carboxyltransferase subunit alpha [Candidatus Baltobacteraceae bacterium]|nr:acetyl-CoA carboxylase carboxyltransferase subunit alpha [Candidatus Baltobacteraceae bacterium]
MAERPLDGPTALAEQERSEVWERVRLARNIRRPHALELLQAMASDVIELHGDRYFGDDGAIVAGFARLDGRPIVFVGQQKGNDTEENIRRNFGSAHPEGFRKAMRLFRLAEKLHLPVVTLVDTSGAHPGAASEERGIAEAIARSIMTMLALRTPIVVAIIGEGGSGGALAVAAGDVVLALENAVYAVISPEGCASILWRSAEAAPQAAAAMRMTAAEQARLGVVDGVVSEPAGGAQEDPGRTASQLRGAIVAELDRLAALSTPALLEARYQRYRRMGAFTVHEPAPEGRVERPGLTDRLRNILDLGRHTLAGTDPSDGPRDPAAPDDEPPLREEL